MAKEGVIEEGDTVKIGSSPMEMTVNSIFVPNLNQAKIAVCIWFDNSGKTQKENFKLSALILVKKKGA